MVRRFVLLLNSVTLCAPQNLHETKVPQQLHVYVPYSSFLKSTSLCTCSVVHVGHSGFMHISDPWHVPNLRIPFNPFFELVVKIQCYHPVVYHANTLQLWVSSIWNCHLHPKAFCQLILVPYLQKDSSLISLLIL